MSRAVHAVARLKAARDQQALTNLESQPRSRPSRAHESSLFDYPTFDEEVATGRLEIPQSPDLANAGADDSTLHDNDEELSFNRGRTSGVVESTSPPGSSRIRQTSHGPGHARWFDSPTTRPRRSPSTATDIFYQAISQNDRPPRSAFIDRQSDAARISPISQATDAASAERRRAQVNLEASRKRARESSDDDESSDEDPFDRDHRVIEVAERRARKPEQTRLYPKRSRLSRESAPAHQLQQTLNASSQPAAPSQAPPSSVPAPAAPLSKRWSEEETQRLIHLVGICETRWVDMKRKDDLWPESDGGPKLSRRTQMNLKDRARTLRRKLER